MGFGWEVLGLGVGGVGQMWDWGWGVWDLGVRGFGWELWDFGVGCLGFGGGSTDVWGRRFGIWGLAGIRVRIPAPGSICGSEVRA